MILKKLSLSSFRNFGRSDIQPGPRFNVFHGKNGEGKTNILEAVFLLGTMKSFRSAKNPDLIRWGDPFSLIRGSVEKEGTGHEVTLLVEREGKKARIDGKPLVRLTDFFGRLNVVIFSPEEMFLIRGMPEGRRKYLDRAIFAADPGYLQLHHDYLKVLRNRNVLLKTREVSGLDIWTEKLLETASLLVERRRTYLRKLQALVPRFYSDIAGKQVAVSAEYRTHLLPPGEDEEYGARLAKLLERLGDEERRRGTTLAGPHRDDLELLLEGKPAARHASQGEQRTFVLALKMAEIELLHRLYGDPPVLLLDDMTSELDGERNRNLMHFLEMKGMQVLITTTDPENLKIEAPAEYRTFRVSGGTVTP